jgi:imidazolonepropionase-like amidohydrolase
MSLQAPLWKIFCLLGLSSFFVSLLFAQTTPIQGIRPKNPEIFAFTNVTLVVSPHQRHEKATLLIEKGRITQAGSSVILPPNIVVYDLTGYTLYPGFIDAYTNYGVEKVEPKDGGRWQPETQSEGSRKGGNAWNDAIHSEKSWYQEFKPDEKASKALMEQGFTAVQSLKKDGIFRGRAFVTLLGEGLPNDLILRPQTLHGASFHKGSSKQSYPSSLMGSIALFRQTLLDAEWYAYAHQTYSLYPQQKQKRPEWNTALKALEGTLPRKSIYLQAILQEKFLFETDDELSLLRAGRLVEDFQLRAVYLGSNREYRRLEEVKALNATLLLPVTYPEPPALETLEGAIEVSLATLRHFERAPTTPALCAKEQIPFAFTTHGLKKESDFLKKLHLALLAGLSEASALAALTTIPAEICGVSQELGTLEVHKLANFLIYKGSPFQKTGVLHSVWIQGKEHVITPIPSKQIQGVYEWTLQEKKYELQLRGDSPKSLQGELVHESEKIKLEILSGNPDSLQFLLRLPPHESLLRFSGRREADYLQGYGSDSQGERFFWQARFKSAELPPQENKETENKETENKEKKSEQISRLTYPNSIYGLENLPLSQNVLIQNATVWTASPAGVLENCDVLVQEGKFAQIGKNLSVPPEVLRLDAQGKYLSPGIIDEHSHIAISRGVNESGEAISAEVRIGDVVNSDDLDIYYALSGGVTTAHLLHGSANPIGGQSQIIQLRWGAPPEAMKFQKAPPSIKFALGENVKQSNWGDDYKTRYPQTRMGVEGLMKDAFQAAKEYDAQWKSYLQLEPSSRIQVLPPRKDLELEALSHILQGKMWIHCHSYKQSEILMLMRLAEEFHFRIQTFTHILEGYKVADEMAQHGASASSFSDWWAYKFEVYDAIPHNVALMHERNVLCSVNSDSAEMGRRLNQEAAKAVLYGGLSQSEALKLVTLNPAIQLKIDEYVGSIEVGKQADFVLWSHPPLSIYAVVEQTWIEGKKYFDRTLAQESQKASHKEKQALIQKILKQHPKSPPSEEKPLKKEKRWHCDDIIDVWSK